MRSAGAIAVLLGIVYVFGYLVPSLGASVSLLEAKDQCDKALEAEVRRGPSNPNYKTPSACVAANAQAKTVERVLTPAK